MKQVSATSLVFEVVSVREVIDDPELIALTALHYEEIAKDKATMKLAPNREQYLQDEASGRTFCVAAKDGDKLAGYCVMWMYWHPHYKDVKCVQSDIYYLLPEYRSGLNGFHLIKSGLDVARAKGARYAFVSTKVGHDHPEIMAHLGLKPRDLMYGGPI